MEKGLLLSGLSFDLFDGKIIRITFVQPMCYTCNGSKLYVKEGPSIMAELFALPKELTKWTSLYILHSMVFRNLVMERSSTFFLLQLGPTALGGVHKAECDAYFFSSLLCGLHIRLWQ
jgi:hypothetical protein